MVNPSSIQNPLRRWRIDQGLSVETCVERSGLTAKSWYQYEAYPHAVSGRSPSPETWLIIREVTDDAVTPNDFSDLLQEAA